jgi:large subunit ribosomal protein L5
MTDQMTPETPMVEDEPMAAAESPVEAEPVAGPDAASEAAPITAVDTAADAVPADPEPASADTEPAAAAAEPAAAAAEPEPEPEAAPSRGSSRRGSAPAQTAPLAGTAARGLQLRYRNDVVPALVKQFEYVNPNQVPRIDKIVVNIGMGEALTNAKAIDAASGDLTAITGQKPIVLKARRSIAQFKIRTGNPIGLKVTLRGQRMWDFLERLTMLALPRIRDFRGIPGRSFDGRGNYTMGLREQIAFPEIDYDKVDRLRGLEVSIVTTAKSDEESKRLLELLGMPFAS